MTRYFPLFAVVLLLGGACKSEETQIAQTETTLTQTVTDITSLPPADDPLAIQPTETAAASPVIGSETSSAGQPTATASAKLPKNHTVDHGGTMHAPGAKEDAAKKCGACHGKDLKGGKTAPSCFDCHEQKWS